MRLPSPVLRGIGEHLGVDVVKLNEAWPSQGLLFKEGEARAGLAAPNVLDGGAAAPQAAEVVSRVHGDRDERVVVLVVEQTPYHLVVRNVEVAQRLVRL